MHYSTTNILFDIKTENVRKIWHYSFVDLYMSVKIFFFFKKAYLFMYEESG